jgi:hypothetical protein
MSRKAFSMHATVLVERALSQLHARPKYLLAAVTLAVVYACLLAWFIRVDFYYHGFFEHGSNVTIYQVARLSFIPCLAWTIYAAGALANLAAFSRTTMLSLPLWERYPLFFISGAGIWHIGLFATGIAGLDCIDARNCVAVCPSFSRMLGRSWSSRLSYAATLELRGLNDDGPLARYCGDRHMFPSCKRLIP